MTVKVAHLRLCHSRMMFVRAYPRETQEMVFDAHERAFAFFKGACTRGRSDDREGRASSALPQPHDVRSGLSARDAGDGLRRTRARLRVLQGRLHARQIG